MKKKLQLFAKLTLILSVLFVFNSCEGDKYYYEDNCTHFEVIKDIVIVPSDWVFDTSNGMYYCDFDIPEMIKHDYENGIIMASTFYGMENKDEAQVFLPIHKDGINMTFDVSYDMGQTIRFYYWYDGLYTENPGRFKIRVFIVSPN